jgi:hypothetical protein
MNGNCVATHTYMKGNGKDSKMLCACLIQTMQQLDASA